MKKYKFKLEGLLKLRKLKEDQCKMQIGQIRTRITELEGMITDHEKGIGEAYESQEVSLGNGKMSGQDLKFHPFFVQGKRARIDLTKAEIKKLEAQVEQKYIELKTLRGDVKVIDEMKTKDKVKFKKERDKKEFETIEEQNQNWRQVIGK